MYGVWDLPGVCKDGYGVRRREEASVVLGPGGFQGEGWQ